MGWENHPARKIESILDKRMSRYITANISATRFLGSFVSTDKGTTMIERQMKSKCAKPIIKN